MNEKVEDLAERRAAHTKTWLRAHGYGSLVERYDALDPDIRSAMDRACSVSHRMEELIARFGDFRLDTTPEARVLLEELRRIVAETNIGRTP